MWGTVRKDGRCGAHFNADCDPKSTRGPCCSQNNECGISEAHCKCEGCVDFRGE